MAQQNSINNKTSQLTVDPGASGDSFVQFDINSTGEFRIGVDDTDDSFRISQGTALGTNDTLVVTADGEVTKPLTSAFSAYSALQSNVTGDGTIYTVTFSGGEYFDQNSDFDGTDTFTAPIDGKYLFNMTVQCDGLTSSHTQLFFNLVTTGVTYPGQIINPAAIKDTSNSYTTYFSVITDMDASDTATVTLDIRNGTKVVDIPADDAVFSCCLVV